MIFKSLSNPHFQIASINPPPTVSNPFKSTKSTHPIHLTGVFSHATLTHVSIFDTAFSRRTHKRFVVFVEAEIFGV
jgi:hypothetical protein